MKKASSGTVKSHHQIPTKCWYNGIMAARNKLDTRDKHIGNVCFT